MKSNFRLGMLSALALMVLITSGVASAHSTTRWDTISLTFPNGVGTVDAGGQTTRWRMTSRQFRSAETVPSAALENR